MHYNGNSWSNLSSSSATSDLGAVWGSSPTDVYAVGSGGRFCITMVMHGVLCLVAQVIH